MLESDPGSKQMGFAMALGILLASFVVSSVLVPAITALAGRHAWWPGRAARGRRRLASVRSVEQRDEHEEEMRMAA
jgi:putative drug exporter of the RND superfamily